MPTYNYFKPSEVRDAAKQLWDDSTTEQKEECAAALGVTTTNLYASVKLNKKEIKNNDTETLRGIGTCVSILNHFEYPVESVPFYRMEVIRVEPAQADHSL